MPKRRNHRRASKGGPQRLRPGDGVAAPAFLNPPPGAGQRNRGNRRRRCGSTNGQRDQDLTITRRGAARLRRGYSGRRSTGAEFGHLRQDAGTRTHARRCPIECVRPGNDGTPRERVHPNPALTASGDVPLSVEAGGARLRPSNDTSVQFAVREVARGLIARADVLQRAGRARRPAERKNTQPDVDIAGGRSDQVCELALGRFQRLVAHISASSPILLIKPTVRVCRAERGAVSVLDFRACARVSVPCYPASR